jgi:hypothetical protein
MLLPGTFAALEIRHVAACSGVVLQMRGDIHEGDCARFKSHFKRNELIVGLDLSSDGGDLEEGLLIANLVRRKKLTVYVAGQCNSVCSTIFFSAHKRYFGPQSKIGVHSVSDYRDIEDPGSMLLTVELARLLAKLGVPNAAIGKMVITRPRRSPIWTKSIYRLSMHQQKTLFTTATSRTKRDNSSNRAARRGKLGMTRSKPLSHLGRGPHSRDADAT